MKTKKIVPVKRSHMLFIITFCLLFICCDNKATNAEYVKDLEERNRNLEEQIKRDNNIKQKPEAKSEPSYNYESNVPEYFTMGSTESEVIGIMGEPNSITNFELLDSKIFYFNQSTVHFKNGKVTSYNNFSNNLRVRYSSGKSNENNNTKSVKHIYFSGFSMISHELVSYYSTIYTIKDYTEDEMIKIKNCLLERIKSDGLNDTKFHLSSHIYDSLKEASEQWEKETGKRIFGDGICYDPGFNF